jgi:hypothetical protein
MSFHYAPSLHSALRLINQSQCSGRDDKSFTTHNLSSRPSRLIRNSRSTEEWRFVRLDDERSYRRIGVVHLKNHYQTRSQSALLECLRTVSAEQVA